MKTCPHCQIPLTVGLGINPTRPDWMKRALSGPEPYITAEELRLDEVWKCPQCGHSQDMETAIE